VFADLAGGRSIPPWAARAKADPTLIRRTPQPANSATDTSGPLPASTLTGRSTLAHTARIASRLGSTGAYSTPAPTS
jgi:hypothetical protein